MASDYGDESGEKMLDNFTRFCELKGESAMRERAREIQDACDHAKSKSRAHEAVEDGGDNRVEWAKLDMQEFREIEGYDEIRQIVEAKLRAHGVEPTWFEDEAAGKEYLLFRIVDAQEVWDSFDELSNEAETAAEKAAEAVKDLVGHETGKDNVEKAAEDPAKEAGERAEQEGPAPAAADAKRRPSHAKTFWQKHDVPVLRDMRPLEERARHAREASAALEAERAGTAHSREPKFQELRSK